MISGASTLRLAARPSGRRRMWKLVGLFSFWAVNTEVNSEKLPQAFERLFFRDLLFHVSAIAGQTTILDFHESGRGLTVDSKHMLAPREFCAIGNNESSAASHAMQLSSVAFFFQPSCDTQYRHETLHPRAFAKPRIVTLDLVPTRHLHATALRKDHGLLQRRATNWMVLGLVGYFCDQMLSLSIIDKCSLQQ